VTAILHEFISSWSLFRYTYLTGWLVAMVMALMGVLAVARNQIFVGAAMSQASTLGIAVGLWMAPKLGLSEPQHDFFLGAMAVAFSIAAALVTARGGHGGGGGGRESREAVTGWVFLFSASTAILMVSTSPHGMEEIQSVLSSSVIGARLQDVGVFAVLGAMTAAALAVWRRPLLLWVMDPATAAAAGVRTGLVEVIGSVWLGLGVGLSIRASGMLYTFGCLVLPALIAKSVCREVGAMFWAAPAIALATAVGGFVVANHYDSFPPAHLTVAALSTLLVIGWVVRRART
jgi:ABC-type Mn2+/Zn2+ transport system permease subunit